MQTPENSHRLSETPFSGAVVLTFDGSDYSSTVSLKIANTRTLSCVEIQGLRVVTTIDFI